MPQIRLAGVGVLGGHRMTYFIVNTDEETREYYVICCGCEVELELIAPFAIGTIDDCYCWECNPYD